MPQFSQELFRIKREIETGQFKEVAFDNAELAWELIAYPRTAPIMSGKYLGNFNLRYHNDVYEIESSPVNFSLQFSLDEGASRNGYEVTARNDTLQMRGSYVGHENLVLSCSILASERTQMSNPRE